MKVLIVDDDALVAQSLATILSAEQDVDVVGTGSSGPQAVARYRELAPDVLLMDIRMPGGDGLSAAEEVLGEDPSAKIVFLTTFSDDEYIARALAMGARGYLIKQDIAQIAPALRGVMAGMSVLEGQVLARGVAARGGAGAAGNAGADPAAAVRHALRTGVFAALTEREFEVVEAVAEGLGNTEVADRLAMSEGTVRNHISSCLAKLGLRNRTQLAVAWYRAGRA
ncbi:MULTISPECIES: response regulator transcription factor [unclassified Actinomyces]|uniref:response regulator transcription factor n=1 Tax=unclassified Actinomyces TaxID=2609248 RepID=UPI0020171D0D|nr:MULTISPECIES: response regulator transcription factor [unclassified Actinomyces]MCL3777631.1 response regulator transcription factor [Actinomyces sp. AC-20-1]MCL3789451.1 response regulator transcription factor [Actinomyces sp. 187325]MCL3793198.1 response regulator transcription factor [Actinomyces sp. 186855]MCL3794437.1 response regulator transcription factor [Actinomyces sp. 217892]